jgi:phage terminase large subunit-like protein
VSSTESPRERWGWLRRASPEHVAAYVRKMSPQEREEWPYTWDFHAGDAQFAPDGDWTLWLIMAGRGFGKTRAGSEWIRSVAEADPRARLALVGASLHEVRAVMVEGESGVLACCPPQRMTATCGSAACCIAPRPG